MRPDLAKSLVKNDGIFTFKFAHFRTSLGTIFLVANVADIAGSIWGVEKSWENDVGNQPHEATMLVLNSNKARTELGWSDKLSFEESVEWTINFYKSVFEGSSPLEEIHRNIRAFESK